jgi:hypothetical protein
MRAAYIRLNIAVVAPMPNASEKMAMVDKPGFLKS